MPLIDPVTMSSLTPTTQSSPTKSSHPIDLLPNDIARIVSQAHPAVLLAAYYIRFPALVANPVPILLQSILPIALLQTAYAVICLPPVRGAENVPKKVKPNGPKTGAGSQISKKAFTSLYSLLLTLLTTPLILATQILLGAPLTTHLPHTTLSSLHLSLLALFPIFYVHGTSASKWKDVISVSAPLDEVFGAAMGTAIGAWLGAVPIPLDWDREWQAWPVTVVTGAYVGCCVGKVVGGFVRGRRVVIE